MSDERQPNFISFTLAIRPNTTKLMEHQLMPFMQLHLVQLPFVVPPEPVDTR